MNVEDITLVTGNLVKAEQISRFLGHRIRMSLRLFLQLKR